jgi:hypothetical protein
MADVTNEELEDFIEAYQALAQRVGGGKVSIDSRAVRDLVRKRPEVAKRYVEVNCMLAASKPKYLQGALMVAGALAVDFNDYTQIERVYARADQLGVRDELDRMAPS